MSEMFYFLLLLQRLNEFGDLFVNSIQQHNMLCLGLYRLHTNGSKTMSLNTRFVITFPPRNMRLEPTDLVFVLMQFNRGKDVVNTQDSQL